MNTTRIPIDRGKVDKFKAARGIASDAELAKRTGLGKNTLYKALAQRDGWQSRTLERLCLILHCSPMDILDMSAFPRAANGDAEPVATECHQ